jgi:hypothetical protein
MLAGLASDFVAECPHCGHREVEQVESSVLKVEGWGVRGRWAVYSAAVWFPGCTKGIEILWHPVLGVLFISRALPEVSAVLRRSGFWQPFRLRRHGYSQTSCLGKGRCGCAEDTRNNEQDTRDFAL